MGGTARQFNAMYINYKKKFKKPIVNVAMLVNRGFTDDDFVTLFKELYPHLWSDLNNQYKYWHDKNEYIIKHGKKSRYNFRKPYNFIMDCSYGIRRKVRIAQVEELAAPQKEDLQQEIIASSQKKVQKYNSKIEKKLYYLQEVSPKYEKAYISKFFNTHDLHKKLEIMRELSKYKSDEIIKFFYKVNRKRNQSLKEESMKYIQGLGLPFVLGRKKRGNTNDIDNEIVINNSSPDILMQRLFDDELEKLKEFDVFISHNSMDEQKIVSIYKILNQKGLVAYVDWSSDKFDLKRQWCNATTSLVIKERIKQSKIILICMTQQLIHSQWCPWEIGYADAMNKKICMLELEEVKDIPEFYNSYPIIKNEKEELFVKKERIFIPLLKWIQK